MATKIKDIIDYYSEHVVSDEIKERVLQRLSDSKDEKEEDEALRSLWDKADSAYMDEEEISTAYRHDCGEYAPAATDHLPHESGTAS